MRGIEIPRGKDILEMLLDSCKACEATFDSYIAPPLEGRRLNAAECEWVYVHLYEIHVKHHVREDHSSDTDTEENS